MDLNNPYKNTILIVDDMPDNITVLLSFLSNSGFRVLVTPNGEQGVKTAGYAHPDLILLDVMMPGIDGFEVCRILKSQPHTCDIPIIFMTALADIVDKVKGFRLGAADYITKPIQHEEVLARVNAHLSLHQLRKQLSEQNRQLQEEIAVRKVVEASLKQRNEELDAFAHMVAHDLKNPLTATISLTELLLDTFPTAGPPSPKWKETLTVVGRSAKKMFSIIEALLLLAGISKWSPLEIKPLDMPKIIEQVLQQRLQYDNQVNESEIVLVMTPWPLAVGYAPWVEEIWANYLSNAFKYSGQPPRLEIGANEIVVEGNKANLVRFWVRDNGAGLTSEEQAKLFTPFTRLHKDRAEGHGLGLSIVRRIVEKLGGHAGVESAPGQGCLFYFTLPRARP